MTRYWRDIGIELIWLCWRKVVLRFGAHCKCLVLLTLENPVRIGFSGQSDLLNMWVWTQAEVAAPDFKCDEPLSIMQS